MLLLNWDTANKTVAICDNIFGAWLKWSKWGIKKKKESTYMWQVHMCGRQRGTASTRCCLCCFSLRWERERKREREREREGVLIKHSIPQSSLKCHECSKTEVKRSADKMRVSFFYGFQPTRHWFAHSISVCLVDISVTTKTTSTVFHAIKYW